MQTDHCLFVVGNTNDFENSMTKYIYRVKRWLNLQWGNERQLLLVFICFHKNLCDPDTPFSFGLSAVCCRSNRYMRYEAQFIQIGFIRYMRSKLLLPITIYKPSNCSSSACTLHIHISFLWHKSRVHTARIHLLILISRKGIKLWPKRIKWEYK